MASYAVETAGNGGEISTRDMLIRGGITASMSLPFFGAGSILKGAKMNGIGINLLMNGTIAGPLSFGFDIAAQSILLDKKFSMADAVWRLIRSGLP
jgi:hypothetical protein